MGATFKATLRYRRLGERTFRLWISRFNELGIDGLIHQPGCGSRGTLAPQMASEPILPRIDDPSHGGQTHGTLIKLCVYLREEKQLDPTYRPLNRYLHDHRSVRKFPCHLPEPPDCGPRDSQREGFSTGLSDRLAGRTTLQDSGESGPLPFEWLNSYFVQALPLRLIAFLSRFFEPDKDAEQAAS